MKRNKIVITANWPDVALAALRQNYDLVAPNVGETLLGDKLFEALSDADVFAPLFYDKVDQNFISELPPQLKLIASFGIGTNHIDVKAARAHGIVVSNTPDVVTIDTADLTIGLMISTARKFYEREKSIRNNDWQALALMEGLGQRVTGKTLGIIGMGRIGQEVAKRAKAFDMNIIYHSRTRKPAIEKSLDISFEADLEALLQKSDFISLHAALTAETKYMINARAFHLMKPTAILINTGRGGLVDEKAMVKALQEKQIAGVGLDVYEYEPLLPKGLAELSNSTLLPHIGTATIDTRVAMALRVKANIDHFFQTGEPLDPVYE